MAKCLKPNFKTDLYSGDINLSNLTGETPEALTEEIYTMLKGLPFSTSIDESSNEDLYRDSIELLVNEIVKKLPKDSNKSSIKKLLKGKLLPRPLTKVEERITAVIEGTDLISELLRRAITYKRILNSIYESSNLGIDEYRRLKFTDEMLLRMIIDTSKRLIIDSQDTLSQGIIDYQNLLYQIILNYLLNNEFTNPEDSKLFANNLYITNPKTKVKTKVSTYTNALQAMYNIILNKKIKGTLLSELEKGWVKAISSKNDDFYNAVSAYINLVYFDNVLKDTLGDFILINYDMDSPISVELNLNNEYEIKYKYKLRKGNINNHKNFGAETQDSLDIISNFSKVLINAIPLYDYRTKETLFGKIQPKDFIGTWTKLKDVGTRVFDNTFKEAILNLSSETSRNEGSLKIIYQRLFLDKNNKTLINKLRELGFDLNNLNILYSFYLTVLYGKNSWQSIENEYAQNKGIKSRYNLVETLFNVIQSNSAMNYLLTVWDNYTESYTTSIKEKYSITQSRWDIVRNINDNTIDRKDDLSRYLLSLLNDKKSYRLSLDGQIIHIYITNAHLLSKRTGLKNYDIKGLNSVDISTSEKREQLIERANLTEEEQLFINILNFIDTMLGTNFGTNKQDMLKLYLASLSNPNFLKEVFLSASRALLITDIYKQFRVAKKSNGSTYAQTELRLFLTDNPNIYPVTIANLDTSRELSEYFIKKYNGYLLKTVLDRELWIIDLAKITTILSGNSTKSVTSNLDGDKIPNYSPTFLGAELKSQVHKSNFLAQSSANLLLVLNEDGIIEMVEDTDVLTENNLKKLVKSMTEGELLYHAMVNKFFIPLVTDGTIYTQPTTYSDKTKFIAAHIELKNIRIGSNTLNKIITQSNMLNVLEQAMIDTIGAAYKSVYKNVMDDYHKLWPTFNDEQIAQKLKTLNEDLLIKQVENYNRSTNNNLRFYKDLHYRQVFGGHLALNELLFEFANNLYTKDRLKQRLQLERINFINDLLSKNILLKAKGLLLSALKMFVQNASDWIVGNNIALARVYDGKSYVYLNTGDNIPANLTEIEMNPMLNVFFMVDNLIGNNLRFEITGSEINHKIKALSKLNLLKKINPLHYDNLHKLLPEWGRESITFRDLYNAIHSNIPLDESLKETINYLLQVYDELIVLIENLGLNALFKRNVSVPATMTRFIPNIYGITETMNIACMLDVPAKVFNFDGKIDKIDAHDGSALINPLWSILENKSLSDNEVGNIKKPIHHFYNDKYMTATLLKYATNTITNQWMRQSEGNSNGIRLREIFKKMTKVRWHDINGNERFGNIDLIDGCGFKNDPHIDFKEDICEGSQGLFYRNGNTHFLIYDFGIENGIYYTEEQEVDSIGKPIANKPSVRIYHYFDNNLIHIPSTTLLNNPNYHTIDSLFELHTILGGIYSESLNSDGNLQYSEASNFATVLFINLIANLKDGANPNEISIKNYDLPLKIAMIHMAANNSAVKNGVANINKLSKWYDNDDLNYMKVGTQYYGILQDSDHTADEAFMTEFSQVINALDAGGWLHDYVKLIYELLGKVALDLARVELDSVIDFRNTGNKTALYDIIGRTLGANLRSGRGQTGLAEAIINNIKRKFNLNTDHALDELKIPFSDHNIYNTILSTFVSNLNKKSIKRQYPGLGTVIAPGYNMSMIYDLNGQTYQYEDLIKLAYSLGYNSNIGDVALKNRDVVNLLLLAEQSKLPIYHSPEIFMPTDNVLVSFIAEKFNVKGLNTNEVEYEVTREPWREDENKSNTDPTKRWKDVLKIYIKGHKEFGSFDLVKDQEFGYYSVHFKTGNADTGETFGSTPELRNILYENLFNAIPEGAYVSTYGSISTGGLKALNKLMLTNYIGEVQSELVDTRTIQDREGNPLDIPIFYKFGTRQFTYSELTQLQEQISLDDINDYYSFTENPIEYLHKRGYYNISNITYQKNILVPRNLAPAKISYEYYDGTNWHYSNIFNHWRIAGLYKTINLLNNSTKLTKLELDYLITILSQFNSPITLTAIEKIKIKAEISNVKQIVNIVKLYFDPEKAFREIKSKKYILQDGTSYQVDNIQNLPAEIIMSNIYKSTFSIKDGDSLIDVLNKGANYFLTTPRLITSDNFDLAFTKQDGRHLYITFNSLPNNSETFDSYNREWENTIRKREPDGIVVNRVFATTDNNIIMFEVGREIIRPDIIYNQEIGKFTLNGVVLSNQNKYRVDGDNVLEYIEFISKQRVSETRDNKHFRYDLYNINKDAIIRAFNLREYKLEELVKNGYTLTPELKFNEEVNNYISELLANIYKSNSFNGVQINSNLSINSGDIIRNVLWGLGNKLKYDSDLEEYLKAVSNNILSNIKVNPKTSKYLIKQIKLNEKLREYVSKIALKKYASFLKSQYFTASRIPSQTLQSFMLMKNVGFTGVETGLCFVSHWQTW